jgi:hypothetical protein
MKKILIFFFAATSCAFAQSPAPPPFEVSVRGGIAIGVNSPVQGAPFSATINNKSTQTLADGNQIVQTSTGTIARDSQGRTRQEIPPPTAGASAPESPRLVMIQDPVAHTAYALDLTDKTAHSMPLPSSATADDSRPDLQEQGFSVRIAIPDGSPGPMLGAARVLPNSAMAASKQNNVTTEDLGSQTMEGLLVNGVRTTRTIPTGQIGNSEPIKIVNEIWTSPDLKTVIYSKRTDPLTGEQVFQLTNIVRTEPDPSLFTVPADFRIVDGPIEVMDQPKQ